MRYIIVVILLNVFIGVADAFEVEDEELFAVENSRSQLRVLSNTDLAYVEPLILAYQKRNPSVSVLYTVASSKELFSAINNEQAKYDVVISSAMDLQMKLVNDGLAQAHDSSVADSMPRWARWRNLLFAFTQEPAVLLVSRAGMRNLKLPQNRQELLTLLRDNPDHFAGKIGTYDLRVSGAGYLFATQDSRQSDMFWRLAEVMGALNPKLYCCSSEMIDGLKTGEIILAYNVVGSYASAVLEKDSDGTIVPLSDYTHFMLRTALIPTTAERPELGGSFIDFLIDAQGRQLIDEAAGLPPIDGKALAKSQHFRPITLGPGLLVYLDRIKRGRFLKEWADAMVQP